MTTIGITTPPPPSPPPAAAKTTTAAVGASVLKFLLGLIVGTCVRLALGALDGLAVGAVEPIAEHRNSITRPLENDSHERRSLRLPGELFFRGAALGRPAADLEAVV